MTDLTVPNSPQSHDAARDPRDGYTADEMNAMVRGETTPQELLEAGVGQDAAALDRSGDTEPASGTSAAFPPQPVPWMWNGEPYFPDGFHCHHGYPPGECCPACGEIPDPMAGVLVDDYDGSDDDDE